MNKIKIFDATWNLFDHECSKMKLVRNIVLQRDINMLHAYVEHNA